MGCPVAHPGRVRITPYGVVRVALGLVLLTAAALKGHQLATEPVAGTGLLTSRSFLIAVVEFELFFGLWLSFGLYPRRSHQLALLCFSTFGCVALYKALTGEATCGCFGRVPVNPWYTLMLDLAAVTALLSCRPANGASSPLPLTGEGLGGGPSSRPEAARDLSPAQRADPPRRGGRPGQFPRVRGGLGARAGRCGGPGPVGTAP